MSSAPSGFNTPKTNWAPADVVQPADMNRIEGNINAIETGSRTIDPTQAPSSNIGTLRQFLDWLANRIKAITGKANWYDAPDISLATLAAHKSRHATNGADALTPADIGAAPSSHTHSGSDITSAVASATNAGNADTIDNYHASSFPLLGANNQAVNLFQALNQQIDTRSVALTYDASGNLTTVTEKDGTTTVKTTTLAYSSGRLSTVIEQAGGKTITITLGYDASGNLTSVTRSVA